MKAWLLLCLTISPAAATIVSDRLDWGSAAANYDLLPNPAVVASVQGQSVTARQAGAAFLRLNQSDGWYGNFSPGEALLWTYYGGPITLDFGAAGATAIEFQIQPDLYGAFSALLEVYDSQGSLAGTASASGVSTSLADGQAVRLSLTGTRFQTARIRLTAAPDVNSFAIGPVAFQPGGVAWTASPLSAVPEPATMGVAAGALGLLLVSRKALRPDR